VVAGPFLLSEGYDIGWINDGDDFCHLTLITSFAAFRGEVVGERTAGGGAVTSGIPYTTVR
jgi:hypothetical protein